MQFSIDSEAAGKTVKEYLYGSLRFSRAQVTRLKKLEEGILLNGERVTVRAVLTEGDKLELQIEGLPEEQNEQIIPRKGDFGILFEDDAILLASKPPRMPTHPTHGHYEDTLANAVAYYMREKGENWRFRAVNRLDRDTSGIVLIAKTGLAAAILSSDMEEGRIRKEYTAILRGCPEPPCGVIDHNIRREQESIITRCICPPDEGERAITEYETLGCFGDLSLVRALPMTGRTHQLRVHFASLGCPILGDDLYGESDPRIARQALHAAKLRFFHPMTGKEMTVEAPLPADMQTVIERMKDGKKA